MPKRCSNCGKPNGLTETVHLNPSDPKGNKVKVLRRCVLCGTKWGLEF